ncbi:MAG: hypothetical protein KGL48_13505 [Sphingomonadales bacterium]|nr:hypothetical protein [Sphingomonadales bacterium]MDE2570200.1 hypothetical protein [Sphingomonadales bacterium]
MDASAGPLLGISPKMYRHFAIVTVVISATVAMFADGNRREAITDGVARREQMAALKQQERKKFGPKMIGSPPPERNSWGSDAPGGFGAPMDSSTVDDGSSVVPGSRAPMEVTIEVDPAVLAKMTPEQRKAYLKKLEDERRRRMAQGPVMPSQSQINNLIAASAARSGSDGGY